MTTFSRRILLLGTVALLGAGAAAAVAQGLADPDLSQLPPLHGVVGQYDLTPRGDVDGLILQDGTEVHFPPDLGPQVVALLKPGAAVTIRGLKARTLPLVQALSLTEDASGHSIVDDASRNRPGRLPPPPPPPQIADPSLVQGVIRMQLHGPRGDLNGVLLQDGTMVHLPPPEADRLADQLKPGQSIAARGEGVQDQRGHVIAATAIGADPQHLAELAAPPPPPPPPPGNPGGPPPPPPAP
ncbi:hypothetical protein [Lichenicola sp.]|uniref:hypothetical protein n=1 Tax=Lichenicola sp. TaxID=2804529 RepID=UPI003B000FF1